MSIVMLQKEFLSYGSVSLGNSEIRSFQLQTSIRGGPSSFQILSGKCWLINNSECYVKRRKCSSMLC